MYCTESAMYVAYVYDGYISVHMYKYHPKNAEVTK